MLQCFHVVLGGPDADGDDLCDPDPSLWGDAPWADIGFSIDYPVPFYFEIASVAHPGAPLFVVLHAGADLDCDAIQSYLSLIGIADEASCTITWLEGYGLGDMGSSWTELLFDLSVASAGWGWTPSAASSSIHSIVKRCSMDPLARAYLELAFENAFIKKRGNEFQDFFSTIMEQRYPGDFIRVRPYGNIGDRKNDGILRSRRQLFQVYAPNELKASVTVAKINEDFEGACQHWGADFDTWVFVHNSREGLGPQVTKALLTLAQTSKKQLMTWGFGELREEVFSLGANDLETLLGPVPTRSTMMNLGLETLAPLLDHLATMPPPATPDLRPPPRDKIQLNMLSEHVDTLLRAGMRRSELVRRYFRLYPLRKDEIAESFHRRYQDLRDEGTAPDQVFTGLQRFAGGCAVPSPATQSGVLAVIAFFFEECDIFERGPVEGAPP